MQFNKEITIQGFKAFYTEGLKRKFTPKHESALNEIFSMIAEDEEWDKGYDIRHIANFLAQIGWETGFLYLPIEEIRAKLGTELRKKQDKYWEFKGRGYIQVTHKINHEKIGKLLGVDLVSNPQLLITDKKVSYLAAARGMQFGIFTGKKLKDYINDHDTDYFESRRIVNGLDKAKEIETFSKAIESILMSASVEKLCNQDSEFYQPSEEVIEWVYEPTSIVTIETPEILTTTETQKPFIIDDKNSAPIIIEKHLPEKLRSAYKYILATLTAVGASMATLFEWLNQIIQNKLFVRGMLIICAIAVCIGILTTVYVMVRNLLERKYAHELTMKEIEVKSNPGLFNIEVKKN